MSSQKHRNWLMRKTPESNWLLCILWLNVALSIANNWILS